MPVSGFRYALLNEDGSPYDPPVFATALPDWNVGDEFLVSPERGKLRILEVIPEWDEGAEFHGVFVVEPV